MPTWKKIAFSDTKLDDWATPDDNTDLNASITAHGLLKKLDNTATNYLDGTGAWSIPAGSGGVSEATAMKWAMIFGC